MEALKLSDLRPEEATFTLEQVSGRSFTLRRCSILDREWMLTRFGGQDGIAEVFRQVKSHEICVMVMRLLKPEDQEFFAAQERTCRDENGVLTKQVIGGAAMLKGLITGPEEMARVYQALNRTIGISEPIYDKLAELALAEEKKSLTDAPGSGLSAGTSSPASTATPSTSSSP